jgi:hypothetical protein
MKVVEVPIVDAQRGLYLCRNPENDVTGAEIPMDIIYVDDSASFNYPDGVKEYIKLGTAESFNYTPHNITGKGTFNWTKPTALTDDEKTTLVAVFDLTGLHVV